MDSKEVRQDSAGKFHDQRKLGERLREIRSPHTTHSKKPESAVKQLAPPKESQLFSRRMGQSKNEIILWEAMTLPLVWNSLREGRSHGNRREQTSSKDVKKISWLAAPKYDLVVKGEAKMKSKIRPFGLS